MAGEDELAGMNLADLGVYLPDDDLAKVDRMTMRHSLEGRVPLLDHRVAEFALSLPMDLKLKGTVTKHVLKRAVSDLLPPAIRRQRKQGFSVPIARWMREDLYDQASRILLSDQARRRGALDPAGVRALLLAHRRGKVNAGHQLWAMLVLELWFRLCYETRHAPVADGVTLLDI